jgi:DnaJ-class molecular chaperone
MYNQSLERIDNLWQQQKKIVSIPPISSLKLHGNNCSGLRVCHTCRGQRIVAIRAKWDNRISYKQCMACSGSGSIETRISQ